MPRGRNQHNLDPATRLEDLAWMADTGESAVGAAERLGVEHEALEKWLRRHDLGLWHRLAARDPVDANYRTRHHGDYRRAG